MRTTLLLAIPVLLIACSDDPSPSEQQPDADVMIDIADEPDVVDASEDAPDIDVDAAEDAADLEFDLFDESDVEDVFPDIEPDLAATGFYHAQRRDGRWWLVTPDGDKFYSIGVNHVNPNGYREQETGACPYCDTIGELFEDEAAWSDEVMRRLDAWGFNTISAWSKWELFTSRIAYTVILNMSGADWQTGVIPDYFSTDFEDRCASLAADTVRARRDDPNLLGWFLDNELRWGKDHRSPNTLLQDYLEFPEGSPGRLVAESHEGDPSGFLLALADRYFDVTTSAIRAEDPNHLVLGVRSISVLTPPEVPEAAADWLDVYSVNHYVFNDGVVEALQLLFAPVMQTDDWLLGYHETTDLPLLITEFSFRSADSDVPNTWPPIYPVLETQTDRAVAFEAYVDNCYAAPYIVGHHWYAYMDEPVGGRFDGEDSNFGLVSNGDVPWAALTERMTQVHARAPHLE